MATYMAQERSGSRTGFARRSIRKNSRQLSTSRRDKLGALLRGGQDRSSRYTLRNMSESCMHKRGSDPLALAAGGTQQQPASGGQPLHFRADALDKLGSIER